MYGKSDVLLKLMEMERKLEKLDSTLASRINAEIQSGEKQAIKHHLLVDAKLSMLEMKVKEIQRISSQENLNPRLPAFSSLTLELN
ncbi:hypothetical protein [Heyndrickxia acidicola]|uniref:Uncharacterized protein n=1 Tax=Heyndrickxia acidicola TaxID=209389 RepID=A0ABU6MPR8_9BACI|nr:hypothetical protein [Heyndrickxia acidicola]MED1205035.1 hypothetical protein [Heyndrickxia acidicola]